MSIAASFEFVDHSEAIKDLLKKKLRNGIMGVTSELADQYKEKLSVPAPPHSQPGEMPHAYLGHKPGGYGPVNGPPGSRNNPGQTQFLKEYIQGDANGVGFAPSHVSGRRGNYLIRWDTGQFFKSTNSFARRTWVIRGYREAKQDLIAAFQLNFERD